MRTALLLGVALAFASSGKVESHAVPPTAQALLVDAQGTELGRATFAQLPQGVLIKLKASNLPPGVHGFHIHAGGACHAPAFASAGGHFNPDGKSHGFKNPNGPHAGDLPNLTVPPNGTVDVETLAKRVTLEEGPNSLFKEGGTSLMIHADPDDYLSDPSGNSGARIACGSITLLAR